MGRKAEKRAIKQAEFDRLVAREKQMTAFRNGQLSRFEAELISAEECAKGDAIKRQAAEKLEREKRELGARLRAGTIDGG
jgi:hypothetical protein